MPAAEELVAMAIQAARSSAVERIFLAESARLQIANAIHTLRRPPMNPAEVRPMVPLNNVRFFVVPFHALNLGGNLN
jgi:hypothetical protein